MAHLGVGVGSCRVVPYSLGPPSGINTACGQWITAKLSLASGSHRYHTSVCISIADTNSGGVELDIGAYLRGLIRGFL